MRFLPQYPAPTTATFGSMQVLSLMMIGLFGLLGLLGLSGRDGPFGLSGLGLGNVLDDMGADDLGYPEGKLFPHFNPLLVLGIGRADVRDFIQLVQEILVR